MELISGIKKICVGGSKGSKMADLKVVKNLFREYVRKYGEFEKCNHTTASGFERATNMSPMSES